MNAPRRPVIPHARIPSRADRRRGEPRRVITILKRRLREGKTYEDFRRAWFHESGFAAQNQMLSMINIADPREIIVIGMTRVTSAGEGTRLLAIDQDERATSPLDEVIEPGVDRTFAALIAKDDFSAAGPLEYQDAAIDGQPTDLAQLSGEIDAAAALLHEHLRGRSADTRP